MKSWTLAGPALAVAFVLTRLPALSLAAEDTDVNLYATYAGELREAVAAGVSFYDLHRQRADAVEYRIVEYPPLAVAVMAVPAPLLRMPAGHVRAAAEQPEYLRGYVGLMALFDVAILSLVVYLVRRLFPAESPGEQCERCLYYVLASWPLYGVLYTRLDLGVALLVTGGLALLVSRMSPWLALAALALAIHFKLMPLVLAPVWILGACPAAALADPWRRLLPAVALRGAVLLVLLVAILAPFYLWQGPDVLAFFQYHKDRGLEIESTWAAPVVLLDHDVYHSHGSVNVRSALTPALNTAAAVVAPALLLAVCAAFATAMLRRGRGAAVSGTVAQTWPRLVAGYTLLLLLVTIAANKVFSPQYLIWALPLVPLLPAAPRLRRWLFATAFGVALLTMLIFPYFFVGEIVYRLPGGGPMDFGGPTPFGAALLVGRNTLFVALTVAVAVLLARPLAPGGAAADNTPGGG